ncbi:MAG: histidine kinase [Acidobacteria bacterium]|nr:histidine kinase [Acidobacteriota bacterium]
MSKEQKDHQEHSIDRRSLLRLTWLGVLCGWLLLSLVTTAQLFFLQDRSKTGADFLVIFLESAAIWVFWAAAAPVIFWLGQRVPLQREQLPSALSIHLTLALAFGLLHISFWAAIGVFFEFIRTGARESFATAFFSILQYLMYVELILYGAVLGAGLTLHARRQARERELKAKALETQLQQAQLSVMKQQLQPHFLFNSLNTISMLVRSGDTQQAVQMIAGLGELLRWSLNQTTTQEIPLASELETTQRYLAIEQFRFPDRLRVELDVPTELGSAMVPNLVLQPLVENAVRHGIAKSSDANLIRIRAERQEDVLELHIEDNGPGFAAEWQPGVGLENTRARLNKLYGLQAELSIGSIEPTGANVRIRIPYHTSSEE